MSKRPPITVLEQSLQNQIAAGEVIERPAGVIKELMENSMDAGSSRVRVEVENGGMGKMSVVDDGMGIPARELELAVTRHATSKIRSLPDLTAIHSFGFRGEALPSIASVSHFKISSKTEEEEAGMQLEVRFGETGSITPTAQTRGTRVEVRDLFANIPARLKFLKTPPTEARRCKEVFQRLALAHLQAEMEYTADGKSQLHLPGRQTLIKRLQTMWPPQVTDNLRSFELTRGPLKIHGVAGDPGSAQGRPNRILLYINSRPVQDKMLLKAVLEAYKGRLLSREYPQAVIFLEVPSPEVDVNVHPAKNEVRFKKENEIFVLVRTALSRAFLEKDAGPDQDLYSRKDSPVQSSLLNGPSPSSRQSFHEEHFPVYTPPGDQRDLSPPSHQSVPSPERSREILPGLSYLGQLDDTYLILLKENKELILVDQHAAHERVLFHQLRQEGSKARRQNLAIPLEMVLHEAEHSRLEKIWEQLQALGFRLESPTRKSLLIRAVPFKLTAGRAKDFLRNVLSEGTDSMEDLWAVMACRAAVKAGESLARDEALSLLSLWLACPDHSYCPHGRPISRAWSSKDLQVFFKRGK